MAATDTAEAMHRAARGIAILGLIFVVVAVVLVVAGRYVLATPAAILAVVDLGISALLRGRARRAGL